MCMLQYYMNAYVLGYAVMQLPQLILTAHKSIRRAILGIAKWHQEETNNSRTGDGMIHPDLDVQTDKNQQNNEGLVGEPIRNADEMDSGTFVYDENNKHDPNKSKMKGQEANKHVFLRFWCR